jgi:hypothetical protein
MWSGGRYSEQEPQVHDFDRYVMERLGMIPRPTGDSSSAD